MTNVADYFGPHWFTPDEKKPAKFQIRPLDGFEVLEVRNHVSKISKRSVFLDEQGYRFVIDRCLLDWRDVKGRDGKTLDFKESAKASLHHGHIDAIVQEVMRISMLTEDQEKN